MSSKPRFVGEKVKLGELISKAKVERCGDRSFPVYSMTMHDGIVEQSGRFKKTIASRDTSSYKVVKKNQLVVGFPIDEGVIYVQNHDQPGIMSPAYNVWDFDSDRILPAYLEFVLHSPQSMAYYAEKMRGTTARRRTLTGDALKNMPVPVPSIEDQYAVVKTLNCIKSQLAATQQMLDKLDQLVKSRFVEMFGDLEHGYKCSSCKLESIAEVGSSRRVFKDELLSEGVPFYRGTEVAELSAEGSIKPNLFISKEHYERLIGSTGKPEIGDLLLPSICPGGQIWCVNTNAPFYFKDGRVLWIRPDRDAVDGVYLRHALSTMFQMSFSNIASGTTFAELKIFLLKELNVPLPELKDQKEFVSFASQVDKSRFIAQQQIEKLQMLYDSLAQDYFGD